MMKRRTTAQIFAMPLLLGLATLLGLGLGLADDGGWDVVACALLALPLMVVTRYWLSRS